MMGIVQSMSTGTALTLLSPLAYITSRLVIADSLTAGEINVSVRLSLAHGPRTDISGGLNRPGCPHAYSGEDVTASRFNGDGLGDKPDHRQFRATIIVRRGRQRGSGA